LRALLPERPEEELLEGDMACFTVIRAMEVMSEATKNVPPEVRKRYSKVPWRKWID